MVRSRWLSQWFDSLIPHTSQLFLWNPLYTWIALRCYRCYGPPYVWWSQSDERLCTVYIRSELFFFYRMIFIDNLGRIQLAAALCWLASLSSAIEKSRRNGALCVLSLHFRQDWLAKLLPNNVPKYDRHPWDRYAVRHRIGAKLELEFHSKLFITEGYVSPVTWRKREYQKPISKWLAGDCLWRGPRADSANLQITQHWTKIFNCI